MRRRPRQRSETPCTQQENDAEDHRKDQLQPLSRAAQTRIRRTICKCSRRKARVSDGTNCCAGDEAAIILRIQIDIHIAGEGSISSRIMEGPRENEIFATSLMGICAPAGVAIRTRLSSQHCLESRVVADVDRVPLTASIFSVTVSPPIPK